MNEIRTPVVVLADLMEADEGWGREKGRAVFQRLLAAVEDHPGATVLRISLRGVSRVDISFASETVVEIARRYRGIKGFCLEHIRDDDMLENWDAAAQRKDQPFLVWSGEEHRVIGVEPTPGNAAAFQFALTRDRAKASEFAAATGIPIANASIKFKQLWEQGFLMRQEDHAPTGGREFSYSRIR
ncbi:MAG: hypothetical protein OXG83_14950 [Acidobacteria bacterium]|nr:hypothetical protein [Acidobacteriota bacterium]